MLDNNVNDLSIEKACEEYNNGVRLTLMVLNRQLDDALTKNWNGLDELSVKIEARTNFLEKNPSFLSCMIYNKDNVKCEPLEEFDDIKVTLQEHCKRFEDKLQEIENLHRKLFDLVVLNGHDQRVVDEFMKMKECLKEQEEHFHDCLDKVTIDERAFADVGQDSEPREKFQVFPDIPASADVERKRPQEDLHERLIQQTIANDSLEGFLKLMERKPIRKPPKKLKKEELESKYAGSLWFFPPKKKPCKTVTEKAPQTRSASACCDVIVTSSQPSPTYAHEKIRKMKRQKLKYYDLLDDIDYNDVKPIKSEYPRRDNIGPMKLQEAKSYLHRMMDENEKVWKKLLHTEKKRQQKAKQAKNLIEYLTAPQQKYLSEIPQSLIVMPVKIIYDNFPTKDKTETPRGAVLITDLTKAGDTRKVEGKFLQAKTETKLLPETRSSPFPVQRKKDMLDQLRGLKLRNDNIQKNIQKAIDVIETKMIDLLASPTDDTNSEAFSAMEEEITTVLKMMSESELKAKEEDQAEKDMSSPKVKRVKKTVKDRSRSVEKKKDSAKQSRESSKDDKRQVKVIKAAKIKEEGKKAADIEEGERLLGQVDNVIKKIDNIYNKFYEEGKGKTKPKEDANFSSIVEFLDGLKEITESPPDFVEYTDYEDNLVVYEESSVFYQTEIYYTISLIEEELSPPIEESIEIEVPKFDTVIKSTIDENRHEYTLQFFYTLFFSGILVALNLDYAS